MTNAGNSSAALLLVTGLISVSMAAIGYYYLLTSSRKPVEEDAKVYKEHKAFATTDANAVEKTVTGRVEAPRASLSLKKIEIPEKVEQKSIESPTMKEEVAVAVEKDAAPASMKEKVAAYPKKEVTTREEPKQEIEPSALHVSPKTVPDSAKKEVESTAEVDSTVAELSNLNTASPKKILEMPTKTTVDSLKKTVDSLKRTVDSPKETPEHPKETSESPKKVIETPNKQIESPKMATELVTDAVTKILSEDFVVTQAVSETAAAFTEGLVQESLENVTLEQEEYVQVDLTQSMTLAQSTPELINVEEVRAKNEEEETTCSMATEDEESIVEEEHEHVAVEAVDLERAEPVIETAETMTALASPKSPGEPPASWEALISSPVVQASTSAEESAAPLALNTPVETSKTDESLSISVPVETSEEPADNKEAASSPVSSEGSSSGRRNRNRSKKSKSKKKKGKKKGKA